MMFPRALHMTSEEYAAALEACALSHADAARIFGVPVAISQSWAAGEAPPKPVSLFLRLTLALNISVDEAIEAIARGARSSAFRGLALLCLTLAAAALTPEFGEASGEIAIAFFAARSIH